MVEQINELDAVFRSLSDPTRRDILKKVSKKSLSISEIAVHYQLTFAAVAKHVDILHHAKLISKNRRGKEQVVNISPYALAAARAYLETYEQLWENRLDKLDAYLKLIHNKKKGKK
jgi:DNA-binding transcriptional ArsR family regulator